MPDPNPEIVPPAKTRSAVQLWRWQVSPKQARIIKGIAISPFLALAGWLLQNFLQLRGVVNLLASRIDLGFLALCIILIGLILTAGVRHALKWRIGATVVIVATAWLVDYLVPRPTTSAAATEKDRPSPSPPMPTQPIKPRSGAEGQVRETQTESTPTPRTRPPRASRSASALPSQPSAENRNARIALKVSIQSPADPAIVVENVSDSVADGIRWELVMFRATDLAFCSYTTQAIGYVKAHSKSPAYTMQLNSLPHAPGSGDAPGCEQLATGDTLIGSLSVDCPTCKGTTLIVSFVWGHSGWFFDVPDGNGRLLLPKNMSKDTIISFIGSLDRYVEPAQRILIQ